MVTLILSWKLLILLTMLYAALNAQLNAPSPRFAALISSCLDYGSLFSTNLNYSLRPDQLYSSFYKFADLIKILNHPRLYIQGDEKHLCVRAKLRRSN